MQDNMALLSRNLIFRPLTTSCNPFVCGELAITADNKGRKRLFTLREEGQLHLQKGRIWHRDIISAIPGQVFSTHLGAKFTIRRPSLQEYVLLMPRGPAPSYPKDMLAMIDMMDVGVGSYVLEAGSGSGGMTLYLSRAVGVGGQVLSFEERGDHLSIARHNYQTWQHSNSLHSSVVDNVQFNGCSVTEASEHAHTPVDAVALDLPRPWDVLHAVLPVLKPCCIVAAYLPNITQVVSLAAYIEAQKLPVQMENVVEVIHRQWTVKPVSSKRNVVTSQPENSITPSHNSVGKPDLGLADSTAYTHRANGDIRVNMICPTTSYIARPCHYQDPHTAFLVKLRHVGEG